MPDKTRVFILAGGQGRRLAPLTTVIPKPLVPIGDQSVLELLIHQLVSAELPRITISLGYLGHLIRAVVGDGERFGAHIDYTVETEPLGTAGALGLLEDVADDDDVLTINGDTFTTLDFGDIVRQHRLHGADATIAAHNNPVHIDFGVINIDDDGDLDSYTEKPTLEYLVSMGVNVVRGALLEQLRPPRRVDMPDFLLSLKKDGGLVHCYETKCFWLDLGRIDDVKAAQVEFEQHHAMFGSP